MSVKSIAVGYFWYVFQHRKLISFLALCLVIGLSFFLWRTCLNMAYAERQRVTEKFEAIVRQTTDSLLQLNMTYNNFSRAVNDEQYEQKLAFAIGMTGNHGKMSINFLEHGDALLHLRDATDKFDGRRFKNRMNPAQSRADSMAVAFLHPPAVGNKDFNPAMVKTINNFKFVLDDLLKAQHLKASYQIHTIDAENASPPLPISWLRTPTFVINYFDPVVYEIWYNVPDTVILHGLLPYVIAAAVLLILIIAVLLLFRRSLQMQHQINNFRSSLFSNATHELKTPLTSLQLIVESFRPGDGGRVTTSQRNVTFAQAEIERMKLLVNRILSYGRMDKEQLSLDKENVHIDTIVQNAINALDLIIQQNKVTIVYTPEAKINVSGDPVLLTNMMTSLIENAIKHSGNEAHVIIDLQRKKDGVMISVSDNGPGIDNKFHKRIFEPFFRVPAPQAEQKAGHGLGLSFAMQVARLHGGSISISSQPGKGSMFIVYLPSIKSHG